MCNKWIQVVQNQEAKQSTRWLQTLWTSFVTRVFATVDPECQTWNTDTEKFHWSDSPYSSSASLSFPSHLFLHLPLPVAVTLLLCGMSGPVCLRAASCVRSHWTFAAQEILSGTGKPHGSGLYILCTSGFDLCIAVLLAKFGTKWPAKRIMSRTKPSYLRESVIKSHSHVGAWAPKIELCASLKSAEEEAAQPARAAVQRKAMENTLTWPTCAKCCVTMYFSSQQGLQTYLKHQELIGPTTQLPLRQRFSHGPQLWKHHQYPTESYWYIRVGEQKFLESKEATGAPCVCLCTRSWAKPKLRLPSWEDQGGKLMVSRSDLSKKCQTLEKQWH